MYVFKLKFVKRDFVSKFAPREEHMPKQVDFTTQTSIVLYLKPIF